MHGLNTSVGKKYPRYPSQASFCVIAGSADEKKKFDELVEDHGVRILIEPAALMHVIGTTMDFVQDRIKYGLCA